MIVHIIQLDWWFVGDIIQGRNVIWTQLLCSCFVQLWQPLLNRVARKKPQDRCLFVILFAKGKIVVAPFKYSYAHDSEVLHYCIGILIMHNHHTAVDSYAALIPIHCHYCSVGDRMLGIVGYELTTSWNSFRRSRSESPRSQRTPAVPKMQLQHDGLMEVDGLNPGSVQLVHDG